MDAINEKRNVNQLLLDCSAPGPTDAAQCLRTSQKRKLAEECSIADRQPDEKRRARPPLANRPTGQQPPSANRPHTDRPPRDEESINLCKAKRFKNGLDRPSQSATSRQLSSSSEIPLISKNQFKKRVLKSYSNKKLLKSKRRRSFSKQILNLNNLSFDTQSAYKFKFEQIIKNVFEKINSCSLEDEYQLDSDDRDILDLNQLFRFGNDSNLDGGWDDNLMHSLKASYLGRGSFGKVFKTRLEQKCYAIKIGLSNSFYGCTGEQHALILNEHPNVVKTHHILKLKLANDEQLVKQRKAADEDFPMFMSTKISYYTMKHIIDLQILKLIDLFPKHKLYSTLNVIIMEFAGDFSLQQLIDDAKNQRITKERRIHFAKQIADALVYLKNKSIAHLDLKPANIMIRKNDDLLKLIDFGCSKKCYLQMDEKIDLNQRFKPEPVKFEPLHFNVNDPRFAPAEADKENRSCSTPRSSGINKYLSLENTIMSSLIKSGKKLIGQNHCNIGTISHTAPEIFRNESVKNIFQADVYSFSIILWQLVTREIPYSGDNIHSIIYRVASGKLRPKFDPLFHLEEKSYHDLTVRMWANIPEHRPNIELVFQTLSRWF